MVGHSTGGTFMLSVPELEARLAGMALVSSAPNASWRNAFAPYAIAAFEAATARYSESPGDETLRALTVAAAPSNFGTARWPRAAVAWADAVCLIGEKAAFSGSRVLARCTRLSRTSSIA
ncbi:hypothetical protein [Nocardia aurantiaca]|uniref:Uncharacterized protein n=1 Tax=Nocardia aurantiaca TaxID=2675850 RepID=A0A6I3KXN5_9NOCA|nr:hypothetical protein [Nocardia aurantiaca]MTE13320.1 hypothetical protein [Nocardia aurantiaca]